METTMVCWGYIGIMEKMEATIVYEVVTTVTMKH